MKLNLVPPERRFFDLFRRQGELVSTSLTELSKSLLEGRSRHPRLHDLEHECDEVTHEIYRLINRTFIAPFEQEDILLLAGTLDDIVDLAEETADKLDLYRIQAVTDEAKVVGESLQAAGLELALALEHIDGFEGLEERLLEIHRLENECDRTNRAALARLFSNNETSAAYLVKWKDIYDLLEDTMDTCEHAANVLETISIKNA